MSSRERFLAVAIVAWIALMVGSVVLRLNSGARAPVRVSSGSGSTNGGSAQPSSGSGPSAGGQTAAGEASVASGGVAVTGPDADLMTRLEALPRPVRPLRPVNLPGQFRNPFRWPASFVVSLPPVASFVAVASVSAAVATASAVVPLSYVGRFVNGDGSWVMLRNGNQAYLVRPGQQVPGRDVRLVSADDDTATLVAEDGQTETLERDEPDDVGVNEVLARLNAADAAAHYPLCRAASGSPRLPVPPGLAQAAPGKGDRPALAVWRPPQ